MNFPSKYSCLKKSEFKVKDYKIIPIRYKDRINIMNWRNEQLYHLRQINKLTYKSQEKYFKEIVANLFNSDKPNQILFSYLKKRISALDMEV